MSMYNVCMYINKVLSFDLKFLQYYYYFSITITRDKYRKFTILTFKRHTSIISKYEVRSKTNSNVSISRTFLATSTATVCTSKMLYCTF